MNGIKVLSLFDGISCGMVALKRAGIKVNNYYASEIEPHAEGVSRYNYPEIIRLGNIEDYKTWGNLDVDIIIGGSPCQDLSIAKKNRQGLDGRKSGLFWKFVECVEHFKPKYFLLENNGSMPNEARDTISKVMGVEPIMINSNLVSAQMRKRYYWTNIPNVEQPKDKGILLSDIIESGFVDRDKSLALTRRYAGLSGSQGYFKRRYFGKSFGQAIFEGDAPVSEHKEIFKKYGGYAEENNLPNGYARRMNHVECERLQTLPDNYTEYERKEDGEIKKTPKNIRYEMIGNGWTVDVIAHIVSNIK